MVQITLKAARINAGLTQKEAASRLGISKNTLSGYEIGKAIPKIDTAKAIANLYGVAVDNIIFLPSDCA